MLYSNLSEYLRTKYGKRLKKICIDGGFSCPNRDGKCGTGGCIFCGERGAGEHIDATKSIKDQVSSALEGEPSDRLFIAYFQNFTNTYAPVRVLRQRYDSALIDERIKILSVGTRPDCIDEQVADLLAEYAERCEVWVELGLQSANDKTAAIINRGYKKECFEKALSLLSERGIKTVVHVIVGLPGEGREDALATCDYLNSFPLFGVKIHSIYVMENTPLAAMYRQNLYTPPTLEEYCHTAALMLARLNPQFVIHRITGDCPDGLLVAPRWNADKNAIINSINSRLCTLGIRQGSHYTP